MNAINQNLQTSYNNQYSDKSSAWRLLGAEQKVKNILNITENNEYKKILEVGAGDGSILYLLSQKWKNSEFYALEISDSGLKQIASKNIQNLKNALKFDGYKIPFEDKFFDLIVFSHVLEHVEHERVLLREIKRVSKKCVIEVPKDYRFGIDNKIKHFLDYGHINVYTPTSLRFLLKTEGFIIEKCQTNIYSKDSFLFNKNGTFEKLLAWGGYFGKLVMSHFPSNYISDKFANTITVLASTDGEELNIM